MSKAGRIDFLMFEYSIEYLTEYSSTRHWFYIRHQRARVTRRRVRHTAIQVVEVGRVEGWANGRAPQTWDSLLIDLHHPSQGYLSGNCVTNVWARGLPVFTSVLRLRRFYSIRVPQLKNKARALLRLEIPSVKSSRWNSPVRIKFLWISEVFQHYEHDTIGIFVVRLVFNDFLTETRSPAVARIADRTTSQHVWGHVTSLIT